jgi:hypothetical protein
VRNGEGLVQVDVANVSTIVAWAAEADLCIHVGAIQIHLTAGSVNDRADLADLLLEYAVRGGIGHHQGGEFVRVLGGLGLEVVEVDVALGVTCQKALRWPDSYRGQRRG